MRDGCLDDVTIVSLVSHVLSKDGSCINEVYVAIHNKLQEATEHLPPGQEGLCNLLLCLPAVVCLLRQVLVEDKVEDKVPHADLKHFSWADHQSCNVGSSVLQLGPIH